MSVKLVATLLAIALVLGYVVPIVVKMKDIPLGTVLAIGVAVMLVDLWQMLRDRAD